MPSRRSPTRFPANPQTIKLDVGQLRELSAVFAAPRWLRDIGIASWLLVGLALFLVGMVALLAITSVIVEPVLIGLVLATVSAPAVSWLQRKGYPASEALSSSYSASSCSALSSS